MRCRLQLGRGLALVAALVAGALLACPLELPRGRSCGDGWWDSVYEDCDPSAPEAAWIEGCREAGYEVDATCSADCELRVSEADCSVCGDGIITGDEECDGTNLGGATCVDGSLQLRCRSDCTLDLRDCPGDCGDGAVNGNEECDFAMQACTAADCPEGTACALEYGCVALDTEGQPSPSCSAYPSTAVGLALKSYSSGTISACTELCAFGRNRCGFCGDGELDGTYVDHTYPSGELVEFPAEVCDQDVADPEALHGHCVPLCDVPDWLAPGVRLSCNFICHKDCSGFDADSILGQPSDCCLAPGSPCPEGQPNGVPELPCCSAFDEPEGTPSCHLEGGLQVCN